MTDSTNPQLNAAASIVVDASKLAQDAAVSWVDRHVTLMLIQAEIALLQQGLLAPGLLALPDLKRATMLTAVVANVIDRLGRTTDPVIARALLMQLGERIGRALSGQAPPIAVVDSKRRH
jgi:hypothetical protein